MLVENVNNHTNFEGKIAVVGYFPQKRGLQYLNEAIKVLEDRVTFAPFDVYIRGDKYGVVMSYSKKFTEGFMVHSGNPAKKYPRVEDYIRVYKDMRNEAAEHIKKEKFFEKLKYFLGIKKYTGLDYKI